MHNVHGARVYPISFDWTTFLPVRALANLFDVPIEWGHYTRTVYLGTMPDGREDTPDIIPDITPPVWPPPIPGIFRPAIDELPNFRIPASTPFGTRQDTNLPHRYSQFGYRIDTNVTSGTSFGFNFHFADPVSLIRFFTYVENVGATAAHGRGNGFEIRILNLETENRELLTVRDWTQDAMGHWWPNYFDIPNLRSFRIELHFLGNAWNFGELWITDVGILLEGERPDFDWDNMEVWGDDILGILDDIDELFRYIFGQDS
jgi:hypothetical protein